MNSGDIRPRSNGQPAPGRPVANRAPAAAPPQHNSQPPTNTAPKPSGKLKKTLIAALIVVLVAAAAVGGWFVFNNSGNSHINSNKYQAVFFTNGQVYFGKLRGLNDGYFRLTDVFYLQTQQNSEDDATSNLQSTDGQDAGDLQLIKLGSEIHGPEDAMIISEDQILFFENLKPDGKVSQSITQYKSQDQ